MEIVSPLARIHKSMTKRVSASITLTTNNQLRGKNSVHDFMAMDFSVRGLEVLNAKEESLLISMTK